MVIDKRTIFDDVCHVHCDYIYRLRAMTNEKCRNQEQNACPNMVRAYLGFWFNFCCLSIFELLPHKGLQASFIDFLKHTSHQQQQQQNSVQLLVGKGAMIMLLCYSQGG